MADVRAKRKSDPSVGGETVAGKRRHTSTALSGKENVVPRARPTSSKKPRLVQEVCLNSSQAGVEGGEGKESQWNEFGRQSPVPYQGTHS